MGLDVIVQQRLPEITLLWCWKAQTSILQNKKCLIELLMRFEHKISSMSSSHCCPVNQYISSSSWTYMLSMSQSHAQLLRQQLWSARLMCAGCIGPSLEAAWAQTSATQDSSLCICSRKRHQSGQSQRLWRLALLCCIARPLHLPDSLLSRKAVSQSWVHCAAWHQHTLFDSCTSTNSGKHQSICIVNCTFSFVDLQCRIHLPQQRCHSAGLLFQITAWKAVFMWTRHEKTHWVKSAYKAEILWDRRPVRL